MSATAATRQAAITLYLSGLTARVVAARFNVSEKSVARWVAESGHARPRGGARKTAPEGVRLAALADLEVTGDPLAHVAQRHRVLESTLRQWCDDERDHAFVGEWVRDGMVWRAREEVAA